MPPNHPSLDDLAAAIWRETYRHDTLLEWSEVKRNTLHWNRTMRAAMAVATLYEDANA